MNFIPTHFNYIETPTFEFHSVLYAPKSILNRGVVMVAHHASVGESFDQSTCTFPYRHVSFDVFTIAVWTSRGEYVDT